ncbi:class I SAM-dependent methyltransferase [Candidatus Protochlamydia phocaeensis]|uniref:class I SAM-dependent methyltransferase n=1 Tax=Candidatus Protochlamydia phocaeensis TaxID=1414722 RepID=UPI000837B573|nr:class I SAM-dependent methyltransferase [Candidatus Protochlamydia phocaeensis]
MLKSYQQLCTEFYDLTKPRACEGEVNFYANLIDNADGPILEAMCGSGRLLIPLLEKGYQIEGVDLSSSMLQQCAKRCRQAHLPVQLYHQSMQSLSLPHPYALIYIPVGSFQLFPDRLEALHILQILYRHLIPGGLLILDISVPWDSLHACIEGDQLVDSPKPVVLERRINDAEGHLYHLHSHLTIYPKEQLEVYFNRYEKWKGDQLLATEEEELFIRWYYRYEMELLLEKAGFSSIKLSEVSFSHSPQAQLYQAKK